jgi:hypothetical protein
MWRWLAPVRVRNIWMAGEPHGRGERGSLFCGELSLVVLRGGVDFLERGGHVVMGGGGIRAPARCRSLEGPEDVARCVLKVAGVMPALQWRDNAYTCSLFRGHLMLHGSPPCAGPSRDGAGGGPGAL